jgi:hypothetical protein
MTEQIITKVIDKSLSILLKIENSILYQVPDYQKGLKEGSSTNHNICEFLSIMHKQRRMKKKRMGLLLVDLKKAFDCVYRELLFQMLWKDAKTDKERSIFKITNKLFANTTFKYNGLERKTNKGIFQGSFLCPILFNYYLDKTLKSDELLST